MAKNNKFVMVGLPLVVRRNTCILGEYFLRCLYTTFMKFKGPFFSFSMLHSFHQSYNFNYNPACFGCTGWIAAADDHSRLHRDSGVCKAAHRCTFFKNKSLCAVWYCVLCCCAFSRCLRYTSWCTHCTIPLQLDACVRVLALDCNRILVFLCVPSGTPRIP